MSQKNNYLNNFTAPDNLILGNLIARWTWLIFRHPAAREACACEIVGGIGM